MSTQIWHKPIKFIKRIHELRPILLPLHTRSWSYFSSLNAFSIVFKLASSLSDTPEYTYNKYYEHYKNAYIKPNIAISLKENNTNMSLLRDWIRSERIVLNKLQVDWVNQITNQVTVWLYFFYTQKKKNLKKWWKCLYFPFNINKNKKC